MALILYGYLMWRINLTLACSFLFLYAQYIIPLSYDVHQRVMSDWWRTKFETGTSSFLRAYYKWICPLDIYI